MEGCRVPWGRLPHGEVGPTSRHRLRTCEMLKHRKDESTNHAI